MYRDWTFYWFEFQRIFWSINWPIKILFGEIMADERTSLFAKTETASSTSYAVPGRFSRRKPTNFNRLQFCIWSSFLWALQIFFCVLNYAFDFGETNFCCVFNSFFFFLVYLTLFRGYRAVFILAVVITIALVVTQNNDEEVDETSETSENRGRVLDRTEFFTLMKAFDGPINGSSTFKVQY